MKWVIKYTDGAYEWKQGSGFPSSFEEARRFDTQEDALKHAENLIDVEGVEVAEE